MNRDQALTQIENATDEEEIVRALRDFVSDPSNGHDPRLITLLGTASDVPGLALELTRFRLAARTSEIGSEDLDVVFGRASVRIAELHDHTGGWKAFKTRSDAKPPATVDQQDSEAKFTDKKMNGGK